jgi:hypothetical protein
LRDALGTRGLTVRLASTASAAAIEAVGAVPGTGTIESIDGVIRVGASDPESIAPAVVRALVEAGGDVVEVRAEQSSLEQIYFEVMGVRPGADGIEGNA